MTEEYNDVNPIDFMLSRHELLVTLNALGAELIPGLGADPLGELYPEQSQLALTIAQRAMRARGFIQFQEGNAVFHRWLLEAVSACAFAPRALMVLHKVQGSNPVHYFAHLTDDVTVLHMRPEDVLHMFSLLPSKSYLIKQLVKLVGLTDEQKKTNISFLLTREQFIEIREYAEGGNITAAHGVLKTGGAPAEWSFVETLANAPSLTVFQFLHVEADGEAMEEDFSVLNDGALAWLLVTSGDTITVQQVSATEFQIYLDEML